MSRAEKIIHRLCDERGLGDRVVLARAAADEMKRLLAALRAAGIDMEDKP